jgi:hypothetical protein
LKFLEGLQELIYSLSRQADIRIVSLVDKTRVYARAPGKNRWKKHRGKKPGLIKPVVRGPEQLYKSVPRFF